MMHYCPKCATKLVTKNVDNKPYLSCPDNSCGYVFWNNPVPVVAGVVETDQGIILAHNKKWPKKIYSIITGFLESSESPDIAIRRETSEELGLHVDTTKIIGAYNFEKMNQVIIAYHVHAKGNVALNYELDDYITVSKEIIGGYDFKPLYITQQIIDDWLANKNKS